VVGEVVGAKVGFADGVLGVVVGAMLGAYVGVKVGATKWKLDPYEEYDPYSSSHSNAYSNALSIRKSSLLHESRHVCGSVSPWALIRKSQISSGRIKCANSGSPMHASAHEGSKPVGYAVGAAVERAVGEDEIAVGELVEVKDGADEGHAVGENDGDNVGEIEGDNEGTSVGLAVGHTVGTLEGDVDGRVVGGTAVGMLVGEVEGDTVGLADGDTVG